MLINIQNIYIINIQNICYIISQLALYYNYWRFTEERERDFIFSLEKMATLRLFLSEIYWSCKINVSKYMSQFDDIFFWKMGHRKRDR